MTLNDFDPAAAPKQSPGPNITVVSNAPWTLSFASTTAFWAGSGGGDADKPSTELQLQYGTGTPIAATPTAAVLATGPAGEGTLVGTTLHTEWSLATDPPGIYELQLVFTLSAP